MSWEFETKNGYLVAVSDEVQCHNTNGFVGPTIDVDIGGAKMPVGVDIKTGATDGTNAFVLDTSFNGEDWAEGIVQINADVDINTTGVQAFQLDATDIQAPFYRLRIDAASVGAGTEGQVIFSYAAKDVK